MKLVQPNQEEFVVEMQKLVHYKQVLNTWEERTHCTSK